jgi:hypothetical protein
MMSFDQAVEIYSAAFGTEALTPNRNQSSLDHSRRWTLRNVNGFLAYVTNTGKVLDQHFQSIGEQA